MNVKHFNSILITILFFACNNTNEKQLTFHKNNHNDSIFMKKVMAIKSTDIYENELNWKKRGLIQSNKSIIQILRNSTNEFIIKLEDINKSSQPIEEKHKQVLALIDNLPWHELDTEEKEFLYDVLSPVVLSAGFDPHELF